MLVANLQQYLRALVPPLQASGAKATILSDLEGACDGLEPFKHLDINTFAGFLRRAEEYDRTGIVPVVAKPPAKTRAKKKEAGPAYTTEDALRDVRSLYERSLGDDVTFAMIEAEVKKLNKLTKPDLDRVTAEFGLGKAKTKPAALTAIVDKISDYKKSHQRTQF
jgi:hypothetical protein